MALLARYWLHLLIAAVIGFALYQIGQGLTQYGYQQAEAKYHARELEGYQALIGLLEDERNAAMAADEQWRAKLADLERSAPKVRTVIRENPSDCVVPEPVIDSLRDAAESANRQARPSP